MLSGNRPSIQQDVPLARWTTLQLGGPARFFTTIRTEPELVEAVRFARDHSLPVFVLGGGSNLLVHDAGFPGLVLHVAIDGPLETETNDASHRLLRAPAGKSWERLVDEVCDQDLSGIECLAGIPGLTGGTPVQNVGAYGQEVSQTIHAVRALDLQTEQFVELPNAACQFSYRSSLFNSVQPGRYVVTAVTFRFDIQARPQLTYADLIRHFGEAAPSPRQVAAAVREIRSRKGMVLVPGDPDCRSAGSFFKNPVVPQSVLDHIVASARIAVETVPHWPAEPGHVKLAAAWLLEHAGFGKGYAHGPVGISSRHSLALITREGAHTADLLALRDQIRAEVSRTFGVSLEQEPVELGSS